VKPFNLVDLKLSNFAPKIIWPPLVLRFYLLVLVFINTANICSICDFTFSLFVSENHEITGTHVLMAYITVKTCIFRVQFISRPGQ